MTILSHIGDAPSWKRARAWVAPMARGISRARTPGLAAEMSFWLFLSVVPLAAMGGLVVARLLVSGGAVAEGFLSTIPPTAREVIRQPVERVAAWHGSTVAPIAVATFVWLAATGVHAIFDGLEVQSGVARPWWKKQLLAVFTCIGLSLGVAGLAFLAAGFDRIAALLGLAVPGQSPGPAIVYRWLRTIAAVVIGLGMVAALYRVGIPREARARFPVWPGAVLAVVLIGLLGWGYGAYLSTAGSGDAYMGGLAAVGVTLMTLWLFSVALLLGAQFNKVVGDRRAGRC
jgi:membrane protein